MKKIREKVQKKLNAMASILMDDIIILGEKRQEGSESIVASFYDENGNKFTFNLNLTVVPEEMEQVEPTPTLSEQVTSILEELTSLKADVSQLKGYHADTNPQPQEETGNNSQETTDSPTEEQSQQTDQNDENN